MLRKQFTQELQQELAVITGYAPIATPSSAKPLTQRTVLRTAASRRKQRFVRKARRAVVWFKALRHQLVIVKRRLRRAQRSRHKRKPRAWRRLLNTLDFEFVLDSTLGTALRFLDKAHAKIQPKIKTKVQLKTKEDKPVQARVHPQKVQKISSTPHKSWPTSPRSTTRARPTAPQSYKKQ
jgi:exonuclease VII large subunit